MKSYLLHALLLSIVASYLLTTNCLRAQELLCAEAQSRAFYGQDFDCWRKAVLSDNWVLADQIWERIIIQLRREKYAGWLVQRAVLTLTFSDHAQSSDPILVLTHILSATQKALGAEHLVTDNVRNILADDYELQKNYSAARSLRLHSIETLRKLEPESSRLAEALERLSTNSIALNKLSDAKQTLQEVLIIRQRLHQGDASDRVRTQLNQLAKPTSQAELRRAQAQR